MFEVPDDLKRNIENKAFQYNIDSVFLLASIYAIAKATNSNADAVGWKRGINDIVAYYGKFISDNYPHPIKSEDNRELNDEELKVAANLDKTGIFSFISYTETIKVYHLKSAYQAFEYLQGLINRNFDIFSFLANNCDQEINQMRRHIKASNNI